MGIAAYRAGKGLFFILVAFGLYSLADKNLPDIFRAVAHWLRIDPERQYLTGIFRWLNTVTETNMRVVASGTLAYAALALTEGIGLFLRLSWAAYLTIAEFAVFIPIEIYELRKRFSWGMLILLLVNLLVVWYLWRNRHRLFRHHLHERQPKATKVPG